MVSRLLGEPPDTAASGAQAALADAERRFATSRAAKEFFDETHKRVNSANLQPRTEAPAAEARIAGLFAIYAPPKTINYSRAVASTPRYGSGRWLVKASVPMRRFPEGPAAGRNERAGPSVNLLPNTAIQLNGELSFVP